MKVIRDKNNSINEEIIFIFEEFRDLNKGDFIQNHLSDILISFSNKEIIQNLLNGINSFNNSFCKIANYQITNFTENLSNINQKLNSNIVSVEDIKEANSFLIKLNFDISQASPLIKFYNIFLGKEDSIEFIKDIKESNLEIRNLNEFIDDKADTQLQISDIDNLLDVYTFFKSIIENTDIKTDKQFHEIFTTKFEENKIIGIKLQGYLNSYGEIYQLYQSYDENSEMTTQKISNILKDSTLYIKEEVKDDKNCIMYKIKYKNKKGNDIEFGAGEIDELKNKILISSGTKKANILNEDKNEIISKEELTNTFIELIDDIQQLSKLLNQLNEIGYPYKVNLTLIIRDKNAFEKNNLNNLKNIMYNYKNIKNEYINKINEGYEKHPFLRLFHGRNFLEIYKKVINEDIDIFHLINSMTLNRIKDFNVKFDYHKIKNNIENINDYLECLFKKNHFTLNEIYEKNKLLPNLDINPGLYKIEKNFNEQELNINIINLYYNLTEAAPINNTLLYCNEETNFEEIKAFFYRAIFCEYKTLFVITNLECLPLSITQELIKLLKELYIQKNRQINSLLIIIYKKEDTGLSRDITKLISDKYNFISKYLRSKINNINLFNHIDLYTSKFAGYGKTTEIKYKVKEKNGDYYYLPIGGTLSVNFLIKTLEKLEIDFSNPKKVYLHIDLSEPDNDDLMNEILMKLIILKYLYSYEKIFYLGYDINIIIEAPKGFIDFKEKYKILQLFKNKNIDELLPLRLEENVKYIEDSPISIVGETLTLLESGQIQEENIDLKQPITKSVIEYEEIINKYFQVDNNNYYQKMNFIKFYQFSSKNFFKIYILI